MVGADWPNNNNKDRSWPHSMSQIAGFVFLVVVSCHSFAEPQSSRPVPIQVASPDRQIYRHSETWYEFLLKQFNPDNLDYGRSMDLRRRSFLDASGRNPYFQYSAFITVLLLTSILLYAKKWVDNRRTLWITAEMMTDLYKHDAYSRRIAREAIQKYNDHIERCNRAIESAEYGLSLPNQATESDLLRTELQRVTEERDSIKRERDLAKDELTQKERILADLSLRLDALAKKSGGHGKNDVVANPQASDQKLVQHINVLQEQLYTERRENRRLKGV